MSLEARGITVVTTAGAVATLLFGFATFAHHSGFDLTHHAAHVLRWAVVAFVVASALAFATNVPLFYDEPNRSTPTKLLGDAWKEDDELEAQRQVARAWGKVFVKAKKMNAIKAGLLLAAVGAEVLGIALIGWVVWLLI